jgi:hypothetical protein
MRIQRLVAIGNLISQFRLFSDFFPQPLNFSAMSELNIEALIRRQRLKDVALDFLGKLYNAETTPQKNVFTAFVTGGGSTSISLIFSVPGASRCVMLAAVPYATAATRRIVSITDNLADVENFVCEGTSFMMSYAARKSAAETLLTDTNNLMSLSEANVIGLGLTAALVTSRPKAGPHRCIVSYNIGSRRGILSIDMNKGAREREDEDIVATRLLIEALAKASELPIPPRDYLLDGEQVVEQLELVPDVIDGVRNRQITKAIFVPIAASIAAKGSIENVDIGDFRAYTDITLPVNSLVYPGSFNPLHEGHVRLVMATIRKHGWSLNPEDPNAHPPVVFEIAAMNADKPPLDRDEIIYRIKQFTAVNPLLKAAGLVNYCICITSAPLFLEKSRLFKRCKFIIGVDTLTRILNPKYYGNSDEALLSTLSTFLERGCKFIVGGRTEPSGIFQTTGQVLSKPFALRLPKNIRDMFEGLGEEEFRVDISSTEIRNQKVLDNMHTLDSSPARNVRQTCCMGMPNLIDLADCISSAPRKLAESLISCAIEASTLRISNGKVVL